MQPECFVTLYLKTGVEHANRYFEGTLTHSLFFL